MGETMQPSAPPENNPPTPSHGALFQRLNIGAIFKGAWSAAILLLIVVFVWHQRGEVSDALREIRFADREWLLALLCLGLLMHACQTQALSGVLAALGRHIPFLPAFMTHAERETLATVMPMGGIASFMILVQRFDRFGVTTTDAGLATMLYSIIGHLSFLMVVVPTLIWLTINHTATMVAGVGFVVVVVSVAAFLALARALFGGHPIPAIIEHRLPASIRSFRSHAASTSIELRKLSVPLLGDLAGVLALWAALHAVHVDVPVYTALAGYVVGTLLMLAAPIFQGLGFVEVSMGMTLNQLGVPLAAAVGATLLYRAIEIWLPVVIGLAARFSFEKRLSGFATRLPAIWTGLNGVLAIASVLSIDSDHRNLRHSHLARDSDVWMMIHPTHMSRTLTLVLGFMLLLLSYRLLRRQRAAWLVVLALSIGMIIVQLTRPHGHATLLVTGSSLIILLIYRRRFRVRSDAPSVRRGIALLAIALCASYGYVVASLWFASPHTFGREFTITDSLATAWNMILGVSNSGLQPHTRGGIWLLDSIRLLFALSLVLSALAVLQPLVWRRHVLPAERERARAIVAQYGDSSQDRFKYWPDKEFFFTQDGGGVVCFGQANRVAVSLGDPVCSAPENRDAVISGFLELCEINGWLAAFHQATPAWLDVYTRHHLVAIEIGREAVVEVTTFSLAGGPMKSLRSAHNKQLRDGLTVDVVEPPLDKMVLSELREVSDSWLTIEGRRERTFTLGQFDDNYLRESVALILRAPNGRAQAFINLIPDGAPEEVTFDLMRHRADAPNGSMDALVLALIGYAKERGARYVSLGMVPFVHHDTDDDAERQAIDHAVQWLAKPVENAFASQSLYAYKDKFHPVWHPRYLIVPNITALPRAALAIARLTEIGTEHRQWHRFTHRPSQ